MACVVDVTSTTHASIRVGVNQMKIDKQDWIIFALVVVMAAVFVTLVSWGIL
jgi:hypothetical protein